jgi:hypothetical protein
MKVIAANSQIFISFQESHYESNKHVSLRWSFSVFNELYSTKIPRLCR